MDNTFTLKNVLQNIAEIVFFIALGLIIRTYIFQPFMISGGSMCPTLNVLDGKCQDGKGEIVFLNVFKYKFLSTPKRGDIVIVQPTGYHGYHTQNYFGMPFTVSKYVIKRVIGMPGDTVSIRDGVVSIVDKAGNNVPILEDFLYDYNQSNTRSTQDTYTVPDGHYFVLGDNRTQSADSRHCFGVACGVTDKPFIPLSNVHGKAEFILYPFSSWRVLDNPYDALNTTLTAPGVS